MTWLSGAAISQVTQRGFSSFAAAARRHEFSNDVEAYLLENSPYERWRWFHRNSPKIVLPLCGFVAQRAQIV